MCGYCGVAMARLRGPHAGVVVGRWLVQWRRFSRTRSAQSRWSSSGLGSRASSPGCRVFAPRVHRRRPHVAGARVAQHEHSRRPAQVIDPVCGAVLEPWRELPPCRRFGAHVAPSSPASEATLAKAQEPHANRIDHLRRPPRMLVLRHACACNVRPSSMNSWREYSATRTGRPTTQP